ncbi:MAG: hypothetical protein HC915_10465 [Anaerolineae bacterium]|nr:hypothetical protein [Anaerolineae bacterium]
MSETWPPEPPPDAGRPENVPMEPLRRRPLPLERQPGSPQREPIQQVVEQVRAEEIAASQPISPPELPVTRSPYREVDPLFAYIFLVAIAVGLSTFEAIVTYVLLWTLMGGVGAMGYFLGAVERLRTAQIDDLFWGVTFGFLSSFPFVIVFGSALQTVSQRMFDVEESPALVMDTWVFMAVAFVIPAAESLFFRGAVQGVRGISLTTVLATIWACVVFFPNMALAGREAIALILVFVFALLNFLYSYVRQRNGLAGAWLCQTVSYTLLWFMPRVLF